MTLQITNGDSTAQRLMQTGLAGTILPWRDILHEGPVPANLSLSEMSQLRARFIASKYGASSEQLTQDFVQRDQILTSFHDHAEVILWFEHDLYDQLQLLQLLDWFSRQELGKTRLSLICIGSFPDVTPFYGLGQLTSEQLKSLVDTRQTITTELLSRGQKAWQTYCAPDPRPLEQLASSLQTDLPFLTAALHRHLEQFPNLYTGLSRTERQIIELVATGPQGPGKLFQASQQLEEAPFLGDTTFWQTLASLCEEPGALLKRDDAQTFWFEPPTQVAADSRQAFLSQRLILTDQGRAVLAEQADWIALRKDFECWLGGVHLQGPEPRWRWDRQRGKLIEGSQINKP